MIDKLLGYQLPGKVYKVFTLLSSLSYIQIERYNVLLNEIRQSLTDLEKGIQGLVVMSSELEDIFSCLYDARVPPSWSTVS